MLFNRLRSLVIVLLAFFAGADVAFGRESSRKWVKVATPELTILTTLSDGYAVERSNEFSQYVAALQRYFGEPAGPLPPLTMVIFSSESDFVDRRPLGKNGKQQAVGGFFSRQQSWSIIGLPPVLDADDQRTIFHEAVHWYLSASGDPLPAWLDEGLAEVFSTFEITMPDARWGKAIPEHVAFLNGRLEVPLRKLVLMSRDELFTGGRNDLTQAFYAEAWVFVHYLIFGESGISRDAWKTYARQVANGNDPDASFVAAFGCTYEDMQRRLVRYMNGGSYHVSRRRLEKVTPRHAETAPRQEVDEALGRLAYVAGRYDAALVYARNMIERDTQDPRGYALSGMTLMKRRDEDAALKQYRLAIERGSNDCLLYFETAAAIQNGGRSLSDESMLPIPTLTDSASVSAADARQAADYYERAIALLPSFEEAYANLAGVIGLAEPLRDADFLALQDGAKRFPANQTIPIGLAQLTWRKGDRPGARALLDAITAKLGGTPGRLSTFVGSIQESWDDEEFFARVEQCNAEKRFAAALLVIDKKLQDGVRPAMRTQLTNLRMNVQLRLWEQLLNSALAAEEWGNARAVAGMVLSSNAPAATKSEVRRIVADLDQRNLRDDAPVTSSAPEASR